MTTNSAGESPDAPDTQATSNPTGQVNPPPTAGLPATPAPAATQTGNGYTTAYAQFQAAPAPQYAADLYKQIEPHLAPSQRDLVAALMTPPGMPPTATPISTGDPMNPTMGDVNPNIGQVRPAPALAPQLGLTGDPMNPTIGGETGAPASDRPLPAGPETGMAAPPAVAPPPLTPTPAPVTAPAATPPRGGGSIGFNGQGNFPPVTATSVPPIPPPPPIGSGKTNSTGKVNYGGTGMPMTRAAAPRPGNVGGGERAQNLAEEIASMYSDNADRARAWQEAMGPNPTGIKGGKADDKFAIGNPFLTGDQRSTETEKPSQEQVQKGREPVYVDPDTGIKYY